MKNNMPTIEVSRLQQNSCFTSDLVFFLNRDYQFIFANDVYLEYHQKKHEEIIGHTIAEHLDKDLFERQVKTHLDCCFENQIVHHQQWFDFPGPGLRYIEISYYPYCEELGEVIGVVANGRDITDGLLTEAALQTAKNQLKLMAKAGNIGLWDWDFRTNKVYFSPEWKQQIGYLDYEISDNYWEWESRVHPMDLDRAKDHVKTFISNPWPNYTNEFRFKHRDGSYRWIMATASLLNDENGQPVRMLGAHIDISGQKEREEELRRKEEALRTAQTVAGMGSWWFNPADHSTKWTEEMFHIFGLPPDSQIPAYDQYKHFFNPNDWALLDASVNKALVKGTGYNLEIRLRTANGQKNRYVNIIGEAVRNEQGVVTLLIGTLQDITHRKIAEQELLASKEKYLNLFESIRDAILVKDIDRTIIDCNQAFVDTFGYDKGDVVGLKTQFLYENESEFQEMGRAIKDHFGEEHFIVTVHYKKKSSQVFTCETSIFYLKDSRGKVSGFICLIRDISERLEIERELRQAQKLEAVGQLAAGIAHEINSPIQYIGDNVVFLRTSFDDIIGLFIKQQQLCQEATGKKEISVGLSQKLEDEAEKTDIAYLIEEIPPTFDQTIEGIRRVEKIVRAMKDFSHPGGDEKTAGDINKIIDSTITVCRNEWKYVAEIQTELDPDLQLVPCFAGEISQVILNIIVNAAHAISDVNEGGSKGKGQINIKTGLIDDFIQIKISDTGGGISEKNQDRIFEPFFTTKILGKGTGQGLAIAYRVVVDKHQGRIFFESKKGLGTTFIIELPLISDK